MIFFAILTVGFVLEIGSGALYFTEQKTSSVSLRPENPSPLNPSPKSERGLLFGQINHGSRLIHTKAGLIDQPSQDSSTVSHAFGTQSMANQQAKSTSLEYSVEHSNRRFVSCSICQCYNCIAMGRRSARKIGVKPTFVQIFRSRRSLI
jgi:hypothetical protein